MLACGFAMLKMGFIYKTYHVIWKFLLFSCGLSQTA